MSARLTVSLGALAANYRRLGEHAQGEVAAVVKADGYGLGATQVAERLWQEGCREFFVASCAEGVQLRRGLEQADIYVLEGARTETVGELVTSQLVPVLNTPRQCALWAATGQPAALHIDTGMYRLGLPYDKAADIVQDLPFPICLLLSHFACADEPEHGSVAAQLARIEPLYAAMRARQPSLRLSLCNSAGLLAGLGPEHLGRAGIGLYGGNPYAQRTNPLAPVVKLEGQVLQLNTIDAGVAVGYGGSFVASGAMQIATLGVGYADGVPRLASNLGQAFVDGVYCPIVGRVSMDLLSIDVTAVMGGTQPLQEGDWVEVLGANVLVDEVAAQAQTLAYEILTGLSRRAERRYVEEFLT